jgi:hypothetical protein
VLAAVQLAGIPTVVPVLPTAVPAIAATIGIAAPTSRPTGLDSRPDSAYGRVRLDDGFYDNSGYDDSNYANPAPPADYGPPQYPAPPDEQTGVAPPEAYRPAYAQPQPPPEPESAVTLVFKDGRPSEQIHNYMLTRTTLYVQDEHRRVISVADLDLAATQKVNKDAGVDFQLPGSGR